MGNVLIQCINKKGLESLILNMTKDTDNLINVTHYENSNCSGDEIGKIIYKPDECQADIMAKCNSSHISLYSCTNEHIIDQEKSGSCIFKENVYMRYECSRAFSNINASSCLILIFLSIIVKVIV